MLAKIFPSFYWQRAPGLTCYFFSSPLRGVQRTVSRNTSVQSSAELPAKFLSESILHYGLSRPAMLSRLSCLNITTTLRSFPKILWGREMGCMCVCVSVCLSWKSMPRRWRDKVSRDAPLGWKVKEIQDAHLELLY